MKVVYNNNKSSNIIKTDLLVNNEDTIETIKNKIMFSLPKEQKPSSINEIYLYTNTLTKTSTLNVMQTLTNNFSTSITESSLKTFCKNFINIDTSSLNIKTSYDYYDILQLGFDLTQEIYLSLSLYSKNKNFVVNPFLLENEDFSNEIQVNTQFNKLLLDITNTPNSTIYFCLAKDLFTNFDKSEHTSFISKTYFPFLFKENILNITQLLATTNDETDDKYSNIKANEKNIYVIKKYNNLSLDNEGIKDIYLKIYPLVKINFPLRIIFDYLHTTIQYPFMKFNPGHKIENLIKLYTDRKTIDNQKIPFLSKKKIIELKNTTGIGNKLAIYINSFDKILKDVFCEFDIHGVVHITMNFEQTTNIDIISDKIKYIVNPLLQHINNFTTQYGYSTITFESMYDNNVEIVDLTYECKNIVEKIESIKTILPCISDGFNFIEDMTDKFFNLVYTKISNFAQMGANEQLILAQFQKTQDPSELINYVMFNDSNITYDDARILVMKVIEDLELKTEHFHNIRFRSIKHPGFPTLGKFEKHQSNNTLTISVSKINNINYIPIISGYVKFIFAFYMNYLDDNIIKNCKKSKQEEKPSVVEIVDKGVDEDYNFEDFPDDDDTFFDDDMIGGGKTNSLKNPTPFFLKMSSHDEILFPKKTNSDKFNAYSKSCPPNYKRQPVMLTEKEFMDISQNHPDSFDGFIKYSSGPDVEEVYYICPRYWCLKNQVSLSRKEVEEGACGGLDAVIDYNKVPKTLEDLPPGKHIYEFYHPTQHDDQKNYRPNYPGFIDKSKHENGLCMPCCMKFTKNKNTDELEVSNEQKKRVTSCASDYSNHYNIEDKPKDESRVLKKQTDDFIYKQESVSDLNARFSKLNEGQLGYLPLKLQYLLKFDNTVCYKSSNEHLIKHNEPCILRWGVEDNEKQSFIAAITKIYNHVNSTNFTLESMKQHICDLIDIDLFISLQNGNLVQVFKNSHKTNIPNLIIVNKVKKITIIRDDSPFNLNIEAKLNDTSENPYSLITQHIDSKLYNKISKSNTLFLYTAINALENFKKFIQSNTEYIDYTYLWDIVCSPDSKLFVGGVNLIILDITNNDSTNRVDVLCPSNQYSKHLYYNNTKSIMLIKQTNINDETNEYYDIFEPIIMFEIKSDNKKKTTQKIYNPLFEPNKSVPISVSNTIKSIKKHLYDKCSPFDVPNLPGKFKFKENNTLQILYEKIKKIHKETICFVFSFDLKCIGIKFKTHNDIIGFIPCYPSSIGNNIKTENVDYVFIDNPAIWSTYDDTINFLKEVKRSNKEIPCAPVFLLEELGMLIGLYTETNQFIQFNPPILNDIVREYPIESTSINPINVDSSVYRSNANLFTNSYAHKLKCNQSFLNAFRLLCRDKLSLLKNMRIHSQIVLYINDKTLSYDDKIKRIANILKEITKKHVKFITYTDEQLSKISNVTLCNSNNTSLFCDKDVLLIPEKDLITNQYNSKTYLIKIADELLRYKTTRDFILDPKQLLFFPTESSFLNKDEILVYDSEVNNLFLDTFRASHKSDFTLNKTRDDITNNSSFEYSNVDTTDCVITKYLGKSTKQVKDGHFSDKTYVRIYDNISFCTLQLLSDIYELYMNKPITQNQIKQDLISLYSERLTKNKLQFYKAMQKQKKNIFKMSDTNIDVDKIVNNDDFYVSNIDIWMFVDKYNIPTILLSNNQNGFDEYVRSKMIILNSSDKKDNTSYIFIIASALQMNKPIKYQMLIQTPELKSGLFNVNKLTSSLAENNSIYSNYLYYKDHYKEFEPKSKLIRVRNKELTLDTYFSIGTS